MAALKVICKQNSYDIIGLPKYHDDEALETVIGYCMDPAKTAKGLTGGFNVYVPQAAYEMRQLSWACGKDSGLRLRHWILSFSPQEAKRLGRRVYEELNKIAYYAAAYYQYEYQIIYAIHEDKQHPHIHFVQNTVSFRTGKKYDGSYADYFGYLKYLSTFLREQYGMTLDAVPDR